MKLTHKIDGALVRTAAVIADDIRKAVADQVDPVWVAENVVQAFPDGVTATPVQARVWAQLNLRFDNRPLMLVLQQLYATGWVLGQDAGAAYIADQRLTKATPSTDELMAALNIDWDNWKPGNRAAEQLVRTSPGLQGLLDQAGATIKGMNATTISRVGTVIADGLGRGASSGSLAKDLVQSGIEGLLADPSRALSIANTEMSRALNVSSMNYYTDSGVERVEWLALEACELCGENADAGPIPLGDSFPSGDSEPPGHPNCRCGIRAVFDYEDSPVAPVEVGGDAGVVLAEAEAVSGAVQPDIAGFVPGQWKELSRDEMFATILSANEAQYQGRYARDYLERYMLRDSATMKFIEKGTLLKNGEIVIRLPITKLASKYLDELIAQVEEIQKRYPKAKMMVSVGTAGRNTYGSAILGDSHINLSTQLTVQQAFEIGSPEAGGFKMPSRAFVSQLRYTLSHEWGHALDEIDNVVSTFGAQQTSNRVHAIRRLRAEFPDAFLSDYGKTNTKETIAELFAEWYNTNGKSDNALVQAAAKEFGW